MTSSYVHRQEIRPSAWNLNSISSIEVNEESAQWQCCNSSQDLELESWKARLFTGGSEHMHGRNGLCSLICHEFTGSLTIPGQDGLRT